MKEYRLNPHPHAEITLDKASIILLRDAVGVARQCDDIYRGYSREELNDMCKFLVEILEFL